MTDLEIKYISDIDQQSTNLLDIIENQLSVIVTINDLDGDLYDDIADDKIKTMTGAFMLIREAQRKLLEDVKKLGK